MEHYRAVIRRQIDIAKWSAILSAIAIVVIPELLLFLILPMLITLITGESSSRATAISPAIPVVIMAMPVIPLILIGMVVYQRAVLTAALYSVLLSLDENLEKLAKRP